MNYDQARQIGPGGPAPGKWNWSSMNDGLNDGAAYTAAPCREPEPGKARCDHDTQEEAERHRWLYELSAMQPTPVDKDAARELQRCDVAECPNWADYSMSAPFYINPRQNWLCTKHLHPESLQALHPFTPGLASIHS